MGKNLLLKEQNKEIIMNKKGNIELVFVLTTFTVFGSLIFAQNQKKAEIIKEKYGYDCNFITVKACEDMLRFEEGENNDYTLELK